MAKGKELTVIFIHGRLGALEPFILNTLKRFFIKEVVVYIAIDIIYKDIDEVKLSYIQPEYNLYNASCKYHTGDPVEEKIFKKKDYKFIHYVTTDLDCPIVDEYDHPFASVVGVNPKLFNKPFKLCTHIYDKFKHYAKPKLNVTPYLHICHRDVIIKQNNQAHSQPVFVIMFESYYKAVYEFIDRLNFKWYDYEEVEQENDRLFSFYDKVIYSIVKNSAAMNTAIKVVLHKVNERNNQPLDLDDVADLFIQLFLQHVKKEFGEDIVNRFLNLVLYSYNPRNKYANIVKMLFLLIYSRYNSDSDLLGFHLPVIYYGSWIWHEPTFLDSIEFLCDSIEIDHKPIMLRYKNELAEGKQNIRLNYLHDSIYNILYEKGSDNKEVIVRLDYPYEKPGHLDD